MNYTIKQACKPLMVTSNCINGWDVKL